MKPEAIDAISVTIDDLCYVTGRKVYDDSQADIVRPNMARKNSVRRSVKHMKHLPVEWRTDAVESLLNR